MSKRSRWLLGGALALALVGAGVGVGIAGNRDGGEDGGAEVEANDSDQQLVGSDRDRAAAAALEHTGGGTVTEVEVGDGAAAYGVEVRLEDGSQVEIQLDASFTVIGQEVDDE